MVTTDLQVVIIQSTTQIMVIIRHIKCVALMLFCNVKMRCLWQRPIMYYKINPYDEPKKTTNLNTISCFFINLIR